MVNNNLEVWNYKAKRVWRSFKILYGLPKDKVEAFINSYEIYNWDWKDEKELREKLGPDYYKEFQQKLVDWYSVINHLCSMGQVEKMYIPPVMDPKASISKNQKMFERRLAKDLNIGEGDMALDIGCGRGCIAMHIASLTGANILGLNIDQDQLNSAKLFASWNGLSEQCKFIFGDMNDLPLPFKKNSLNAVYHVQAFSICKDLQAMFNEVFRIMKPGGRFCALDWVSLPAFNPNNPHHQLLMSRVKPLIGAIGTPTSKEYVSKLKKAGFIVRVHKNLSVGGLQEPLIDKADVYFNRIRKAVTLLVKCNILPKHFTMLFDKLTQDGQAFVEADRLRLVTTSYYIVAEKPIQ